MFNDFQSRVGLWAEACFGPKVAKDKRIRNFRFLEEALELVQSLDCTKDEAHQLVEYVFNRPVGDPPQELGGTLVTLAALAEANGLNLRECGWTEQHRCERPEVMDKIRAKQASKIGTDPLPGTGKTA